MVESQTRQSDFMRDRVDALQAINKYSLQIQYSQQPIQALKDFYSPGEQIRIVLQRSANIIQVDKLALLFRPIIKFQKDALPDIARKSFQCITPIQPSDFFQMTSCTFNGNQLLSQSGVAQDTPRNLFLNYYNSLRSTSSSKIAGEEFHNGLTFPMLQFNSVIGCEEGEIGNHPQNPNNQAGALDLNSIGDADPFPRAIISKVWSYNEEHNLTPSDQLTRVSNAYFGGFFDANMNVAANTNCGNIPTTGVVGNGDAGALTYAANYPLKPMQVSASNACYRASMERFQHFRMRWITATTSVYGYTGAAVIQTSTTVPTGQLAAVFNKTLGATILDPPTLNIVDAQRITYGTSIQHPYGTNQNSNQRFTGQQMTQANSTYFPTEQYTNTLVHMGEVSIELDQIKYVDMSNTQIVIILQLNNPNQVLSAYLQPGLGRVSNAAVGGNYTGPSSADCQTFLNCCLLGSAAYQITDLCCRIPYLTYPQSTYPFVRQMCYEPQVYQSLRVQMDPINSLSSVTTQRLSIGGSAIINGVISFIVPRFSQVSSGVVRPQDTVVDYSGLCPPSLGDLRCLATLDSMYIPYEQYQVQLDSRIYESSPLIPISNPSYASYLKSMEAVSDIFKNKEIPIDLRQFLHNRSFIAVSINPQGDMQNLVVDQQMVVSVTFNGASRFQHAQMMGTQTQQYVPGSFQLLTFIITQQSLVNCDYVRVM